MPFHPERLCRRPYLSATQRAESIFTSPRLQPRCASLMRRAPDWAVLLPYTEGRADFTASSYLLG